MTQTYPEATELPAHPADLTFTEARQRYQAVVFAFVARRVRPTEEAEDVVAAVFVDAFRHWSRRNPIPASTPLAITLGARKFGDGSLARLTANFWFVGEETNAFWQWSGTISGRPMAPGSAKPVTVMQASNVRATCGASPAWTLHISHGSFHSEEDSRMQKARRRATIAMQQNRWTEAEEQLNEVQKSMRDSERKGYGTYSRDAVLQDLDKVHAALGR